jgi:hypothetical protein
LKIPSVEAERSMATEQGLLERLFPEEAPTELIPDQQSRQGASQTSSQGNQIISLESTPRDNLNRLERAVTNNHSTSGGDDKPATTEGAIDSQLRNGVQKILDTVEKHQDALYHNFDTDIKYLREILASLKVPLTEEADLLTKEADTPKAKEESMRRWPDPNWRSADNLKCALIGYRSSAKTNVLGDARKSAATDKAVERVQRVQLIPKR